MQNTITKLCFGVRVQGKDDRFLIVFSDLEELKSKAIKYFETEAPDFDVILFFYFLCIHRNFQ